MSNSRGKSKQQHRQETIPQHPPNIELPKGRQEAQQPNEGLPARQGKKEPSMSLGELWKRCSLTDRIIAFFTAVLAVTSIYQFIVMNGQLNTMRKDQRPWVDISFTPGPAQALAPIGGTIRFENKGKTPARGVVRGEFVVEKVRNREQPRLDYTKPYAEFTMGMITPEDAPLDMAVQRLRSSSTDKGAQADRLTVSEFEEFSQVKIFFVIYGTIYYSDFFGTSH